MSEIEKRKKPGVSLQLAAELGKLPPQAVDLEEAVLGAMMLERDAIPLAMCIVQASDFYKEAHMKLFAVISDMFNAGVPVDILTVTQELRRRGELEFVGGPYYISQLTNRVASSANIEFHSYVIKEKSMGRNIIKICTNAVRDAYDDSVSYIKLAESVSEEIMAGGIIEMGGFPLDPRSRVYGTLDLIKKAINEKGVTGVPCGLTKIDRFTGGFQPGNLIFIGARPGHYKTALSYAFAHKMVPLGFTPFIVQQEMDEAQSAMRELAMYSGISTEQIRRGQIDDAEWVELEKAAAQIAATSVFIDHTGGMSIRQIKAKIKKQTKIKKIDILFIDYLQLLELETGSKNTTDEALLAKTTRKLKLMAKELKIPVICLSQLSREVEKRPNKRPLMSDLKGSGAIEADADVVILLYNASKYSDDPVDSEGNSLKGKVEMIFCKNRQGSTGSEMVGVHPETNVFFDLVEEYERPVPAVSNLNGKSENDLFDMRVNITNNPEETPDPF